MGRRQDSGQDHPQAPACPSPPLEESPPFALRLPSPFLLPSPLFSPPFPGPSPPTPLQFPPLFSSSLLPPFPSPSLYSPSLPRPAASPSPGSQKALERQLSLRQEGVLKSQEGKTVKLNPRLSPRGWGWLPARADITWEPLEPQLQPASWGDASAI